MGLWQVRVIDGAEALQALRTVGLDAGTATPILGGWAFFTFDVDGAWIARFPRDAEAARAAERELALLPELAAHLSFPVPSPSHDGSHAGDPFFVYPRIPGRGLTAADASPSLLARVGRMLAELHGFPVDRAAHLLGAGPPDSAWRRHFEQLWTVVEEVALPGMDGAMADDVRVRYAAFLVDPLDFAMCLVHNDLGAEHLLVDEATHMPTGIIDFESAAVGDPAIDLVPFVALLGPAVLDPLQAGRDLGDGLEARMSFYRWMGSIHAVIHAVGEDDQVELAGAIAELRRRLARAVRR